MQTLRAGDPPEGQRLLRTAFTRYASAIQDTDAARRACGATDWGSLDQRMHYIAHLFRGFHDDTTLLAEPFNAGQLAALAAGRIPDGTL